MNDVSLDVFLPTSLRPGQTPQREAMLFGISALHSIQSRTFDDLPEIKSIILLRQKIWAPDGSFFIDGFFSPLTAEEIKRLICVASPQPAAPHLFPKPRLVACNGALINPTPNPSCG